jgi:predicted aspartyl protease
MKFDFKKWPCLPCDAFPDRIWALRPTIYIAIKYQSQRLRAFALLDTGADYCMFPKWIGERLGIEIPAGKKLEFRGAAGGVRTAYFHDVVIEIGGWDHKCYAGFTCEPDEPQLPYGILGTLGFFDSHEVIFNVDKNTIKIKKLH